jgi:hypothetical protein
MARGTHHGVARIVEAAGPECATLRGYLESLRRQLGMGALPVVPVPMPLVRLAARFMQYVPGSLVEPETIAMLERGNCASSKGLEALLGRPPRAAGDFIPPALRAMTRADAALRWALPLLRLSIATVFLATALLTFGLYPLPDSYALLARSGSSGSVASLALYGGGVLDLLLGVAVLLPIRRQTVYLAMAALIIGYTAIITATVPDFWLHPFGPVLKNLPILAALALLHALDRPR